MHRKLYHQKQPSKIENSKPRSVAARITIAQHGQQFAANISLFHQGRCVNRVLYFLSGYQSAERAWNAAYQKAQVMADAIESGMRLFIARPQKHYAERRAKA